MCFTPEPEFLTMHRCIVLFHTALHGPIIPWGEDATWNSIWLHSNQSTYSSLDTQRKHRLDSLCWTKQYRQIHALTSNLIWRFSNCIMKVFLTSQLLYLMGLLVDKVKMDWKEFIWFSFWKKNCLTIMILQLFLMGKTMELYTDSEKCWDAGHRWL